MKKRVFIIFGIELLALLVAIVCLFIKKPTIVFDTGEFEWVDDKTIQSDIKYVKHGVYNVKLYYNSSVDYLNTVLVCADKTDYDAVKTNQVLLYENLHETDYNCAITHTNNTVRIRVLYGGEGDIEILGAELVPTNIPVRIAIFWIVLVSLLVDFIYWLYIKKIFIDEKKRFILAILSGCLVLVNIPMMLNYVVSGGDLLYHYMRIDQLAEALKQGQFPVRLYPEWMFGHGYADAVMYGHTLLYIPALLRLVGFSITFSYQALLFSINALTIVTAYICFSRVFSDKFAGVIGTFLYTMMPYRLFALYTAANIGIVSAGVFLPIVFLGMYKIFTDDTTDKKYKLNWIYVSCGLVGVVSNHTLSTEIVCGFILLTCLVLIKKVFKYPVFISLIKALVGFVVLGLWFIVPFVDNYINYDFHVKNVSARVIQYRGIEPSQFFTLFIKLSTHDFYGTQGLQNATIMTPGFAVTSGLLAFIVLLFVRTDLERETRRKGCFFALLGLIGAYMCTLYFPWDWIQGRNQLFATLVSSLQFPTRFILFYGLLVIPLSCIVYKYLDNKGKFGKIYLGTVIAICIIQLCSFSSENSFVQGRLELYDAKEAGTGYTSGGEYLPQDIYGIDNEVLKYRDAIAGEKISISNYKKDGLYAEMDVVNESNEEGYVDVPLLNYIGYTAYDANENNNLCIVDGEFCETRVIIPANYNGKIVIKYVGKWYWHLADGISLAAFLALIFMSLKKKFTYIAHLKKQDTKLINGR